MIDGSQFLKEFQAREPHLALLLQQMIDGINGSAQQVGINPNGKQSAPPPIQGLEVNPGDGIVHVRITDNAEIQKNVQYFVEYADNPAFQGAQVEHLGASRTRVISLPAQKQNGDPHTFYWRAYSQYIGSEPNEPAVLGGKFTPTSVVPSGATKLDLLPSAGSGTASPDGQQAGQGLGRVLIRAPQGPKIPAAPAAEV